MATPFSHRSVLLCEAVDALLVRPDGTYVDGTLGGGGHSAAIAEKLTTGRLIGIDRDAAALAAAKERLAPFAGRVTFARHNFSELADVLSENGISEIDGFLLDLGVSSYQFDAPERGFSYRNDAPLDMRMDQRQELSAYTVVNTYSEEELRRILFVYGEEKFAPRIAARIVGERAKKPIETTGELVSLIEGAIPVAARDGGHPAKRTFQAIRIAVNGELDVIAPTIRSAVSHLSRGGRIAIITFHSLEDRIVKETFADLAKGCICPKTLPICVCHNKPKIRIITKKPIVPGAKEMEENPRAHSAKLRVAEKC